VTGKDIDEEGLYRIAERVFNLNRAILIREGHRGIRDDRLPDAWHNIPLKGDLTNPEMLVPGKGDEVVSRKGKAVDKEDFARMREEYYQLRHWDAATGLQTRAKLRGLELEDVARELERRELVR